MKKDISNMIDKRLIELIHEDLEGNLSSGEQQKLREQLTHDQEAAGYYNDWKKIQENFERNREASPDVNLVREILQKIPAGSTRRLKPDYSVKPGFWRLPSIRYGLVFAAGVFLGFLVFAVLFSSKTDSFLRKEQVVGTVYDSRTFDQMKVADNLLFEIPGIKATFDVRYSTGMVEVRITMSSRELLQCVFDFNYNELQVLNVASVSFTNQSAYTAAFNWVKINNVGSNQYIVQLLNKNKLPHRINIRLSQNDLIVYQNAVTINEY